MSAKRRSVVITGIGPVTACGAGADGLLAGLRARRSPVAEVTHFDPSPFRSHMAAEIAGFDPTVYMDAKQARRIDRFVQFSLCGTKLAIQDAGLDTTSLDPARVAVQMGSAMGGLAYAETQLRDFITGGAKHIDPRIATTTFAGAASCFVAIEYGFTGPNTTNAMSCAAGTIAVGEAARLIREGVVDVAIAGGVDAPLAPVCYGAFATMRAMSQRNDDPARACRPFDKDRDGFVMGEGSCAFVLESAESARARGAKIYAELRGYGINNDAYHMAAPRPDGSRAADCMRAAIASAELSSTDIGHVNAHASSTPLNDATESKAIRMALGAHADKVPVTGTKSYHGHALGASGAIEIGISCLTLRDGWIPPTLNLETPGEGCDLDYVTGAGRDAKPKAIVSNSFGFGGINAVVVMTAASEIG
ncbi:MAG: beta-ketoacyl-[acyl-carrier-protein] synthase family protein [Gemmatimonadetes bacterium]|nr:beta-ketoacyl-[acyl-carrier-protein] synthase family protein [Gemmatimonadota bacterium]